MAGPDFEPMLASAGQPPASVAGCAAEPKLGRVARRGDRDKASIAVGYRDRAIMPAYPVIMMSVIRTQISMSPEQAEGLRLLAALRQRSQSALLREALDGLLAASGRERRIDAARGAIGRYGSGLTNTADDHDAALDDAFSA